MALREFLRFKNECMGNGTRRKHVLFLSRWAIGQARIHEFSDTLYFFISVNSIRKTLIRSYVEVSIFIHISVSYGCSIKSNMIRNLPGLS